MDNLPSRCLSARKQQSDGSTENGKMPGKEIKETVTVSKTDVYIRPQVDAPMPGFWLSEADYRILIGSDPLREVFYAFFGATLGWFLTILTSTGCKQNGCV